MDRYNRQVAAARKAGLAITRRQQNELSSLLQDFADELGDRIASGFGTTNDVLLEREVRNLIGELHSGVSGHILKHSRLQARTLAEMHARAHHEALGVAGLSGEAFENRMTGLSASLAQAVFAQDGITDTFKTLSRGSAQQAQLILKRAAIRGSSVDSVEKQMRLLVQGADSIPEELLVDRRLISKRTLTEYLGIQSPTNSEVAAVRRSARQVAGRSRLISRTSLMNVEQEATAIAMAESPIVEAGQWFLSNRHKDSDQCDVLAFTDFYELGDGVYPSDAIPPRPHPRCLCGVSHILRPVEDWGTKKKRGAPLKLNPKIEGERRGLNKSQTFSLRRALGTAEIRSGARLVSGPTLSDKVMVRALNSLTGSALTVDSLAGPDGQFAKIELAIRLAKGGLAVRTVGAGAEEYFNIIGAAGLGPLAAGQGFFAVQRLIRQRAARQARAQAARAVKRSVKRRAAEDPPRMRSGSITREEYNRRFSVRDADGKKVGLARAKPPPVPPARDNLKRNLKDMEEWLANESVEHGAVYDKNGRLLYLVQGDGNSLPTAKLLGTSLEGATSTHNHPPWATDYLDPRTYYSLSFSRDDVGWSMQKRLGQSRVTTPFRTYALSPKRKGSWSRRDWVRELDAPDPNRNSFTWRQVTHTADGPQVREALDDIGTIAIRDRYDDLHFRINQHLNVESKGAAAGLIRPEGLDPGEWDFGVFKANRYSVYATDAEAIAARAAGQIRAVSEMQFEEIVRELIWKQMAREFNWNYVSTLRKTPLIQPHRIPLLPFEIANWSDSHGLLFTVGLEPDNHSSFDISTFGLEPPDFDSQIARELRAGGRASKWSPIPRIRRKPYELTLNVADIPLPRTERLVALDRIRATLTTAATTSRKAAVTVVHEVREAFGLVPENVNEFIAHIRHPMRMKEVLDDLLADVGKYVPDRWMPPALAYRSRAHYTLDRMHRNRTPGRRNNLDLFPELGTPAAGRSLLDENLDKIDDWLTPQTHESLFILDRNGRPITFRQGTTGSVPITQADRVLMEGATVMHNHAAIMGNLTFSGEDLFELAQGRARRGVLTTRRYRFTITPRNKVSFRPEDFAREAFEELDDLRRSALDKVLRDNTVIATEGHRTGVPFARRAAAITIDEAEERALHTAMTQMSARKGWTYTRIERATPNLSGAVIPLDPIDAAHASALVARDYDRVTALTVKRDKLRTLSSAFADADPAQAAAYAARADEIDVLLLTGTDPEVGWLNAPRWLRRSAEQAEDDHGLAELILMRLKEAPARPSGNFFKGGALERMALKWRDKVEPKLRALGFPQEPFDLPDGLGQGMRSAVPLSTSRDLAESIVRELDLDELRYYVNRFPEEFGFNSTAMFDDIDNLSRVDFDAIRFGAGIDNLPDSVRAIAKHRIQRETTLRLVDAASDDGVFDFWQLVREAEDAISAPHAIDVNEIRDQLLGHDMRLDPVSGVIDRMIGPSVTEAGRENLRTVLLQIADDLDRGIITPDPNNVIRHPVSEGLFSVLEEIQRTGGDLSTAANAIRVEVGTHTATRKWRSVQVEVGQVLQRNIAEELVAALGGEFQDYPTVFHIFEDAARDLPDAQLMTALHRAQMRTLQERTVAGVMDVWAATSGRSPAAIAIQLAVDKEMALSRAMKKHLGADALPPQRKTFIKPFRQIHESRNAAVRQARHTAQRKALLVESLEAIQEDIREGRLRRYDGQVVDQPLFSERFVDQLMDELNSAKRPPTHFTQEVDGTFLRKNVRQTLVDVLEGERGFTTDLDSFAHALENAAALDARDALAGEQSLERMIEKALVGANEALEKIEGILQTDRRILEKFEAAHSIPLPPDVLEAAARIERLTQTSNKLNVSYSALQDRVKRSPLLKIDPPGMLVRLRDNLQDLIDGIDDIPKTKEALRFSLSRQLSGDVKLGITLKGPGEKGTSIFNMYLTRNGAPLSIPPNTFTIAANHIELSGSVIQSAGIGDKFADFLRAWDGVDEAAVIRFAEDIGLETGGIARLRGNALLAKGQLEALDMVKELFDDNSLNPFISFLREDIEVLEKYVTGGQLEADKLLFLRLGERQQLANRVHEARKKAIAAQQEFFENATQHAMLADPETLILDIDAFEDAVRRHAFESQDALNAGGILFERDETILRQIVRDVYEQTQRSLEFIGPRAPNLHTAKNYAVERAREAGYSKIILVNGEEIITDKFRARLHGAKTLLQGDPSRAGRISREWSRVMGAQDVREVRKPLQEFVLWRGVGMPEDIADSILNATDDYLGRVTTLRFQPLSSFSTSPMSATNFVRSNHDVGQIGALHMVRVDRRQIFSTPFTGPGCLCEHEFTVLGGHIETLTLRDAEQRIGWWEALSRLRVSGLVTKTEMAEWARFTRLKMLNKELLTPKDVDVRFLGLIDAINVDDIRQQIEDAFETDWDKFDQFWGDVLEGYVGSESLLDDVRDEFLLNPSPALNSTLDRRTIEIIYGADVAKRMPDDLVGDGVKVVNWLNAEQLPIEDLWESVQWEIGSFQPGDLQRFGGELTDEFETWYSNQYFEDFEAAWLDAAQEGFIPDGLLDELDPAGAAGLLDVDAVPGLTQ